MVKEVEVVAAIVLVLGVWVLGVGCWDLELELAVCEVVVVEVMVEGC